MSVIRRLSYIKKRKKGQRTKDFDFERACVWILSFPHRCRLKLSISKNKKREDISSDHLILRVLRRGAANETDLVRLEELPTKKYNTSILFWNTEISRKAFSVQHTMLTNLKHGNVYREKTCCEGDLFVRSIIFSANKENTNLTLFVYCRMYFKSLELNLKSFPISF